MDKGNQCDTDSQADTGHFLHSSCDRGNNTYFRHYIAEIYYKKQNNKNPNSKPKLKKNQKLPILHLLFLSNFTFKISMIISNDLKAFQLFFFFYFLLGFI